MGRILTFIPDAPILSIAVQGRTGTGARQPPYGGRIIAEVPGQFRGKLVRENHNFGFKHNRTSHPIPCASINQRVA